MNKDSIDKVIAGIDKLPERVLGVSPKFVEECAKQWQTVRSIYFSEDAGYYRIQTRFSDYDDYRHWYAVQVSDMLNRLNISDNKVLKHQVRQLFKYYQEITGDIVVPGLPLRYTQSGKLELLWPNSTNEYLENETRRNM